MDLDANRFDIGENQIEVRVRDGKHSGPNGYDSNKVEGFDIANVKPEAPENSPPVLDNLVSDKASPEEAGAIVTWTAKAEDPENDQLSYRFFLNGQPATEWQSESKWSWTTSEANVGENQVEVRIRDGKHAAQDSSDDTKTESFVIIRPNQKPVLTGLSPDKLSPQEEGTSITWTAEASDPDNNPLVYRFLLRGKIVSDWNSDNSWTWSTTSDDAGDNQIEVQVSDKKHAALDSYDYNKKASFHIIAPKTESPENQPPVIISLIPDKSSPQEPGTSITWIAEAKDPDGDQILYKFFQEDNPLTDWTPDNKYVWIAGIKGLNPAATELILSTNRGNDNINFTESEEFIWPYTEIEVRVRDGKHADPDEFDDKKAEQFNLAPQKQSTNETTKMVSLTEKIAATRARLETLKGNNSESQGSLVEPRSTPSTPVDPLLRSSSNNQKEKTYWWDQASSLLDQAKWNEAIQALDKIIELDPTDFWAWSEKETCLGNTGRFGEALECSEKALQLALKPGVQISIVTGELGTVGHYLYRQGRYDEALKFIEKAIKLDPNYFNSWRIKAEILNSLGRHDEAQIADSKSNELMASSTTDYRASEQITEEEISEISSGLPWP
jgi:tetratricopeptide (TPR) repeat protein